MATELITKVSKLNQDETIECLCFGALYLNNEYGDYAIIVTDAKLYFIFVSLLITLQIHKRIIIKNTTLCLYKMQKIIIKDPQGKPKVSLKIMLHIPN